MKNLDKELEKINNEKSMHLFRKPYYQLTYQELGILDEYDRDQAHPQWKDIIIKGNKTHYQVSNTGMVRNTNTNYYLSPSLNKKGYQCLGLSIKIDNKTYQQPVRIHRLVAIAFVENPNPEKFDQVNHINGVKTCNWYKNLEWIDNDGNQRHSVENCLWVPKLGTDNWNAYHTEEQIHQICQCLSEGMSNKEIAEKLNVDKVVIYGIKYGCNWNCIRSMYDIPKPPPHQKRSQELIDAIDEMVANGIRDKSIIRSQLGIPDTKSNFHYIKWRIRLYNEAHR